MNARRFTVLVPTGWARIPVGRGSREAVRTVLDRSFADVVHPSAAVLRRQLEGTLTRQLRAAAGQHAAEIYLPVTQVRGITVPASVVVSLPPLEAGQEARDLLLALAARDGSAEVVDVGGEPAVRVERHHAAGADGTPASRQVLYHLGDGGRYAVLSGTVLEGPGDGGSAVADATTELVDAMASTFRWAGREETP